MSGDARADACVSRSAARAARANDPAVRGAPRLRRPIARPSATPSSTTPAAIDTVAKRLGSIRARGARAETTAACAGTEPVDGRHAAVAGRGPSPRSRPRARRAGTAMPGRGSRPPGHAPHRAHPSLPGQVPVRQHPARSERRMCEESRRPRGAAAPEANPTMELSHPGTVAGDGGFGARPLLRADPGVVRDQLRRADRRPGPGLAGHRGRRAHPAAGAHRLGQDARRLPGGHRPAGPHAGARPRASGAASSTSRRCAPSPSTSRRTSARRSPGIALAAERLGEAFTPPTVAMRTGDTPAKERQHIARTPPDILITTPESLYLMLTSQAREILRSVETVIVDEIHALAPTKRGADLALVARAARRHRRRAAATHRALGHATPARRDRAVPRRPDGRRRAPGHDRRRGLAQRPRHRGDRPGRRHDRAAACRTLRRRRARPPTRSASTRRRPTRASGRTCTRACSS